MKKITKCKACGKEISKGAKACPHCGEFSAFSEKMIRIEIGLVFFGIGFLIPVIIEMIMALG